MRISGPPPAPPLRILVADDDPLIADSLCAILRGRGYEVLAVYEGCAALLILEAFRPQLALLDYNMPGATGLEVAKIVLLMLPTCRVYILSAYLGLDLPEDGESVSGVGYIQKPIRPVDLLAILEH